MASQNTFYQTLNMQGVDPTTYYVVSASVTPETPAPPFLNGTKAIGSDGSEFIFVQASTSISLSDFVIINTGSPGAGTYMANSVTNTNVMSSLAVGLGATGIITKQSLSYIPAGAYFWAQTKGQFIPAFTSGASGSGNTGVVSGTSNVLLYTTATAGQLTTSGTSIAVALAGFAVISSLTVSIPSSVVPPVGVLTSTGFTQGPVVSMNNVRTVVTYSLIVTGPSFTSLAAFW